VTNYREAIRLSKELEQWKARAEAAEKLLTELYGYTASVWFDEATATDEERDLMRRVRALEAKP
jgi:hypothetical protein